MIARAMFDASDLDHLADLAGAERLLGVTGEEADVLVSCATSSIRVHAHEDALSLLRAALMIDPEHARAWSLMGTALEKVGQLEAARSAYAKALLHDDQDPTTALALARIHLAAGRFGKARALIDWVVSRFPDSKHARQQAATLLQRVQTEAA
jgi:Flp pilus assembly protein TadD